MSSTDSSTDSPSKIADGSHDQKPAPEKRPWHRRPGRKIDDLLLKRHQRYAPLSRLIRHSDQRESLTATVRALLPDALGASVEVANYRPPTLILRVNNASFATRLRYLLPDLTIKLTLLSDFRSLDNIRLRVVHTTVPPQTPAPPRYLSASAANSLTQIADSLAESPDYQELRAVFLRLSEHTESAGGHDD